MTMWNQVQDAVQTCSVSAGADLDHLHPFALKVLSMWSRGALDDNGFLIGMALPNSDYIGLSECIVRFIHSIPL